MKVGAERPAAGALKSFLRAIQLHEAELKSNGQLANGDAQANGSAADPGFHRCRNNAAVLAFRCGKVKLAQELIEPVATVSWVATLAAASVLSAADSALWQAAVGCLTGRLGTLENLLGIGQVLQLPHAEAMWIVALPAS